MKATAKKANQPSKVPAAKSQEDTRGGLPAAWVSIDGFCTWFRPSDAAELLWQMLKLALTKEEQPEAHLVGKMIFFYERAMGLFEDVDAMLQEQKIKYKSSLNL